MVGEADPAADLTARARRDGLPLALVAIDAGAAIGAVALAGESLSRDAAFGAWIVGLWVAPDHRGHGLGGRLLEAAKGEARRQGIGDLRAGTTAAEGLFARTGWRRLAPVVHEGRAVAVFGVSLGPGQQPVQSGDLQLSAGIASGQG